MSASNAAVAQLVRAPACHAGGCRFKSGQPRQRLKIPERPLNRAVFLVKVVLFYPMKVISLNSWGGRMTKQFSDFITEQMSSTDVFCFQEVLKGGRGLTKREEFKSEYEDISAILSHFTGYFFSYGEGGYYQEPMNDLDFQYGIACFVRSNLTQSLGKGITLYDLSKKWSDYTGGFAAGAALAVLVEDKVVVNVHGFWQGGIKEDTEAKLEQSRLLIELADSFEGKKVICGDFNLLPQTQSIQLFRDRYQDLIQVYDIRDTRGALYRKELRYSDYAFVDNTLSVKSFSVPPIEASDHLPLFIDLG
jgi:endonuclease/exonuclease/phosphatase family metal-dependent hydrolase